MKLTRNLFFILLLFSFNAISQNKEFELPSIKKEDEIVYHQGYTLSYNEKYEQANWVAYVLTEEKTHNLFSRTNKFLEDPQVSTGSADNDDYQGSGYDRGHLAPAADMEWSAVAVKESFYYSNMSPQVPAFNRGIWKHLEEFVREAAVKNKVIYVVTGPVLSDPLPTIGHHHVAVPKYYYKVILDYQDPEKKGIGFLLPNENSKEPLANFSVSIDSVEKITHINFFPMLTKEEENVLEKTFDINKWQIQKSSPHHFNPIDQSINIQSDNVVQCTAMTKKGKRCRNMTKNSNGLCHLHQ